MSEQTSSVHNPFMLMINPEVVIAMMEKSERLAALNRHTCRPLDRVSPSHLAGTPIASDNDIDIDEAESSDVDVEEIGE